MKNVAFSAEKKEETDLKEPPIMTMDHDLLIIGGGAAGKETALLAARAWSEDFTGGKEKLGGTSYHRGCYVIRALQACARSFRASGFSEKDPANLGAGYGYLARGWSDWSQIRLGVTDRLTRDLREELAGAQIRVDKGSAKFVDSHTVQISSSGGKAQKITADNIIIATGSGALLSGRRHDLFVFSGAQRGEGI